MTEAWTYEQVVMLCETDGVPLPTEFIEWVAEKMTRAANEAVDTAGASERDPGFVDPTDERERFEVFAYEEKGWRNFSRNEFGRYCVETLSWMWGGWKARSEIVNEAALRLAYETVKNALLTKKPPLEALSELIAKECEK